VTNTGWLDRRLHLDVASTLDSNPKVTALINQNQHEIALEKTDLQLPPCSIAHIAIVPQRWYETFPDPVMFTHEDATLKIEVPESGLRWSLTVGGVLLLITSGLGGFFCGSAFAAVETKVLGAGKPSKRNAERQLPKPAPSAKGSILSNLDMQSPLASLVDRLVIEPPRPPTTQPDVTVPSHATDSLEKALNQYRETVDKQRLQSDSLKDQLAARLPRLPSSGQTQLQLRNLEAEFITMQAQYKRWQEVLKDLGDSPEAINTKVQTLRQAKRTLEERIFEIQVLLTEADTNAKGHALDSVRILDNLRQIVLTLMQLKNEYEMAAMRILNVLDPTELDKEMLKEPDQLATRVEQLRGFTDRVLQKYTEPLQVGTEANSFNLKPVADIENHFEGLVKPATRLRRWDATNVSIAHVLSLEGWKAPVRL